MQFQSYLPVAAGQLPAAVDAALLVAVVTEVHPGDDVMTHEEVAEFLVVAGDSRKIEKRQFISSPRHYYLTYIFCTIHVRRI